ncbi:LysR family transcriptional regulator [Paraburkholderia piptadeniae]|uniref:LysR family transcriptional regulator n=1 Tax=Paraburkholderia piptadeniae TaxID=1701573 RepID=A0A1N7RIH8_9BURK|nr:LysR substrate-binding domain-containing protein [Paraburkholderia piptadeniae]SIT34921.1 LysR family transcriptional regulator [Paraburkholderia piptadeniae]
MTLDLDLLRAFVAVAESGSFTAAAHVVGRSQSAVSQKVLRLEDALNVRVFERTSRSLKLTHEGERVLAAGRRLLAQYDAFIRELQEPPQPTRLRLGVSENLVQSQLPLILARFGQRFPSVQLDLTAGSSQDLIDGHEAGLLDVVFARRKREGSPHRGRVIWREPLVWLAAKSYRSDPTRPAPLIMMPPPCAYREVMTETLDAARREWSVACTASNLLGVQAAVVGGLGVTALGKSFLQNGMKILPTSAQWPALPASEVAVIGEDPAKQFIVEPLVSMFVEVLTAGSSMTLDTEVESE